MVGEKRDFDKVAATWDDEPRIKLAEDVAGAVLREVRLAPDMDVLDYGCGTGLVTMRIQPHVRAITGADTSKGMLEVLHRKANENGAANVRTLLLDPEQDAPPEEEYHLIVSNMTLHHVEDVGALFRGFFRLLLPGGKLCVADLDTEDGSFHPDKTGVFHFGFNRGEIGKMLANAGFVGIRDVTASVIVRATYNDAAREYPVFLVTAEKTTS